MLSLVTLLAMSTAQPPPPPPQCDVVRIEVSTDGGMNFQTCPTGQSLNSCNTLTFRVTTRGNLTSLTKNALCGTQTQTPILGSEQHDGDVWTFAYNVANCGPCTWTLTVTPVCGGTTGQARECQFNLTKNGCVRDCCCPCPPRLLGRLRCLLGR